MYVELSVKTPKFCQHWTYCNCIMRGCVGDGVVEEVVVIIGEVIMLVVVALHSSSSSNSTSVNNSISSCNDCLSGSCGINFSVGSIDSVSSNCIKVKMVYSL